MASPRSALYRGKVMHQRLKPRRHRLSYSMFSLLLDLDEIGPLAARLLLFSRNRFNLFSFHDRDYGDGTGSPLRSYVERQVQAAGLDTEVGSVRLLTMPRILGYAFNPLSVYFCYQPSGALSAILYEVNNTFGERHSYMIPVGPNHRGTIVQECVKRLYVSPFIGMEMTYAFRIMPPAERLTLHITGSDRDGPLIVAAFAAERSPLTDAALMRAFVFYPLLTLKVIAGIHWEALKLWMKGVRLQSKPPAPEYSVSVGHAVPAEADKVAQQPASRQMRCVDQGWR